MEIIKSLEYELVEIVNKDKHNWTHFYLIMKEIEAKELWKEISEKSFTSWVKNFCIKNKIHESIIWNRKKAGKVYETYEKVKRERGEEVIPLEHAKVSVDALVLLDKINKRSPELATELTEKAINNEITREDLRNAYKTIRGDIQPGVNKLKSTNLNEKESKNESSINITAALIVNALSNSEWLGVTQIRKPFKTSFEQDKYKLFTEFPVFTGTSKKSRRIDVLISENLTSESWELNVHAIEIKVNKYDLLNDKKYSEYADFADYVWLAVPRELVRFAMETKFDNCGIIAINNNDIEIVEQAKYSPGLLKFNTLMSLVLKLL